MTNLLMLNKLIIFHFCDCESNNSDKFAKVQTQMYIMHDIGQTCLCLIYIVHYFNFTLLRKQCIKMHVMKCVELVR